MFLDERKLQILQAIIGDFISSAEPVGSRTLSKKYDMGISPATIRNEMSDLEAMGFLTHVHTSSGRIPSNKAYRYYVDALMESSELSPDIKTVFLITKPEYNFISSSTVKEIFLNNGDISNFVPEPVKEYLLTKK